MALSSSIVLSIVASTCFFVLSAKGQEPLLNPQKPVTVILSQSKEHDKDLQDQLDAILQEFIAELDNVNDHVFYQNVIEKAFGFQGTRYRYGGTTLQGIDCSGLVMNAFADQAINLPRSSSEMAKVGEKVTKNNAQKGDLIFFKTRGNRISHVGIITEVLDDEIMFIHSSTSRGVIVSSTKETYYKTRFVQINRVL